MQQETTTTNTNTKPPTFEDITLYDVETGEPFTFTASEQEFYWKQGFTNVPKYSPERRKMKREQRYAGKIVSNVRCKQCGKIGRVLQEVPEARETLCGECFDVMWNDYLATHPKEKQEFEAAEAAFLEAREAQKLRKLQMKQPEIEEEPYRP